MVAAVDDGEDPPPSLRLAWMSRAYSALPESGGVLEQEYAMMHRMGVVSSVYDVLSRMRNYKGKQIHSLSISERRIIKSLRDMKLI